MHTAALLALFFVGYAAALPATPAPGACGKDWIQSKNGKKCYLILPRFKTTNIFSQITFCNQLGNGARAVQPETDAEFLDVQAIVKQFEGTWTDGPWTNIYNVFQDNRIVTGSDLQEIKDAALKKRLADLKAKFNDEEKRCAGYNADGSYDFDVCTVAANPFCERPFKKL